MTQDLLKLKEDKLIFLDIETVRRTENLEIDSEEFNIFSWKVRDKDTDQELDPQEVIDLYKRKAALYPAHAMICAITVGFIHKGEKIILKTYRGEEKEILRRFVDDMVMNKGFTLVIWNAPFDIPMIRKRFFINRLRNYLSDDMGNDSMKKPWTLKGILDLMDVWKGIGFYNESMNEVAWAMGLPSPKGDMNGSMVSQAYYEGEIDRIVVYNQFDVKTLINLYRIFTEKEPISDENVIIKELEKIERVPVYEQILAFGAVTADNRVQLLEMAKGATEEDKENIITITKGALGRNEKDFTEEEQDLFTKIRIA